MMFLAGAVSLLKLTFVCTCGGLAVTMANDKDIHKFIKGLKKKMVKRVKAFNIGNEHCTVLGLTQHGKTYGTIKTLDTIKEPILFFNTNETSLKGIKGKWYDANGSHDMNQLIHALKEGYKVNFIPSTDIKKAGIQLKYITDEIYNYGRIPFRFVIDEVHLFWMAGSKPGQEALTRLASTGLGRGYKCMFLSQRPAMVNNTLLTQSTKHILFALGLNDESYLKQNGFPVEQIKEATKQEKYVFAEFDQKEVKGGYTII